MAASIPWKGQKRAAGWAAGMMEIAPVRLELYPGDDVRARHTLRALIPTSTVPPAGKHTTAYSG
jgi:hypothetical protein